MNVENRFWRRLPLPVVGALLLAGLVFACGDSTEQPAATASPAPQATKPGAPLPSTPGPSGATPAIEDALWKKVREEGTVMVIVTLNIPYQPETLLGSQQAIDDQRAAIAAAQDELIAALTAGHVEVNTRMTLFPQLALTVDEPALRQLAASPLVATVEENALSAPTSHHTNDRTSL